jgi:hypothetical protein
MKSPDGYIHMVSSMAIFQSEFSHHGYVRYSLELIGNQLNGWIRGFVRFDTVSQELLLMHRRQHSNYLNRCRLDKLIPGLSTTISALVLSAKCGSELHSHSDISRTRHELFGIV